MRQELATSGIKPAQSCLLTVEYLPCSARAFFDSCFRFEGTIIHLKIYRQVFLFRAQELPPLSSSPNQPTNYRLTILAFRIFPFGGSAQQKESVPPSMQQPRARPTFLVLYQFYLFIQNHSMNDHNRQNILGIAWYVDLINPI